MPLKEETTTSKLFAQDGATYTALGDQLDRGLRHMMQQHMGLLKSDVDVRTYAAIVTGALTDVMCGELICQNRFHF